MNMRQASAPSRGFFSAFLPPLLTLSAPVNTPLNIPTTMAFPPVPRTTSSPSVELLMDVANTTQEITSRLTARVFSAIAHPERGPALRE